ncbi:MAG: cytochrome C, partial [Pirellulales bacterium]|nr:cytochrome C [Pirellulales bacterium]
QGTIGYFCYRCHSPVGTTLGISRAAPLWTLPQVAREGVTCVACHRVNERFGKVNGERRIEPGDIHAPVYGSIGGSGIAEVIARKNEFKVKTSPHEQGPGQDIHAAGFRFDQLGKSEFCVSCHQVAVHPGIKLEVVWEQYRASPACKKGISCQDCHMGRLPGVPSGYAVGAAAKVNGKVVNTRRKHANHVFYGPGYSIAHPGIFPHNPDANRWSMRDWLLFDWRAGWGTAEFEERMAAGQLYANFPSVWAEADDRYDAREIIEDNLAKLGEKKILRQQVLENGSNVDGPFFDSPLVRGNDLKFHYVITNTNEGHNLPSGSLGAQPQLWANVVLIGPGGRRLWESGYTDRWGDVADIHSADVRQKRIPFD